MAVLPHTTIPPPRTPTSQRQADSGNERPLLIEVDEKTRHSKWRYTSILIAAFMINFTACGVLFGFGIYLAKYETMALEDSTPFTGATSAQINLIGSLAISMMTLGAPIVVAWIKHFRPQVVVCSGGVIFGLASVLASFGTALWHFQMSQGLLMGIGTCLSFMPSMTVAPTWFDQHRGVAMGMISAGTGIGGLVWAPAIRASIDHLGFRNTLRLTGTLSTILISASGAVLDWEPSMVGHLQGERDQTHWLRQLFRIPLPDSETAKDSKFIAQALGSFCQSAAYYTPVFFIASYMKTLGYSDSDGANFTALSNACNAIGKIGVGFIADRIGRLNSFLLTTALSAAVCWGLWLPSTELGSTKEGEAKSLFIGFTVLYGLFASAYISLFPAALVELFGVRKLPQVTGLMYMMQGMAALLGTPLGGVLIRGHGATTSSDGYRGPVILVSSFLTGATACVAWIWIKSRLESKCHRQGSG